MRILQVVPSYLPAVRYGGPLHSVHGLSRALVRAGHEVRVVTTDMDDGGRLALDGAEAEIDGVAVRYGRSRGPARLRWAPELRGVLAAEAAAADLVHVHGVYTWIASAGLRAGVRAGAPTVLSPRGMLMRDALELRRGPSKRAWLAAVDGRALGRLAALHVTSRRELDQLPRRGRGGWPPVLRVPNGIDPAVDPLKLAEVDPDLLAQVETVGDFALFLGRLSWKKGLDRLIDAWAADPGLPRLLIAGPDDGWGAELARRVGDAGLGARIRTLGTVRGAAKRLLLERARCLVCPSYSENFGNVVLEAMAAGCPPVVTPEVGAAELVAEHRAGAIVDGTPLALAHAVHSLCADGGARAAALEGSARGAAMTTWDAVAEEFLAQLSRVGEAANASPGRAWPSSTATAKSAPAAERSTDRAFDPYRAA